MSKYTDKNITDKLKKYLALSVTKKDHNERTSSVACSERGSLYYAGIIESDTNTFNISSEQVSLSLSTISNDYKISKIITMVETVSPQNMISPIVSKIIKDHCIRTGLNIEYTIIDTEANILFYLKEIDGSIPYYKPEPIVLSRISQDPTPYTKEISTEEKKDIPALLKFYAIKGLEKNFPLYDSASGYATAILTKSNKVFFGGQYSSPDKRLGLHSEVNAILGAFMNNEKDITHIGLVSTKYKDSPCNMCGNCRQFISEMMSKHNCFPELYLFSKDTDDYNKDNIQTYLPSSWTSKKWTK